jgi:hypothetical protein
VVSWFVQVTLSPTFAVVVAGLNEKFWIVTASAPDPPPPDEAAAAVGAGVEPELEQAATTNAMAKSAESVRRTKFLQGWIRSGPSDGVRAVSKADTSGNGRRFPSSRRASLPYAA